MRLPAPILEHPIESVVAGLLLMALLFVSAGPEPGMGGVFVNVNRGKRSMVLDLRSGAGQEALRALVARADVFIHSMRAKAIAALGFGYPEEIGRAHV